MVENSREKFTQNYITLGQVWIDIVYDWDKFIMLVDS